MPYQEGEPVSLVFGGNVIRDLALEKVQELGDVPYAVPEWTYVEAGVNATVNILVGRMVPIETAERFRDQRDRLMRALESFRTMQGEVHPILNQELVPVEWVLDVVDKALGDQETQVGEKPSDDDQPEETEITEVQERILKEAFGPMPTREEILEAAENNDQFKKDRLWRVLEHCVTPGHAETLLNRSFGEIIEMIKQRDLVAVDLGSAGYFLPTWQFDESEGGEFTMNPGVKKMWDLWGPGFTLDFCNVLTLWEFEGYCKTALELIKEGIDAEALEEIEEMMRRQAQPYV